MVEKLLTESVTELTNFVVGGGTRNPDGRVGKRDGLPPGLGRRMKGIVCLVPPGFGRMVLSSFEANRFGGLLVNLLRSSPGFPEVENRG